jgi:hypothetical protein
MHEDERRPFVIHDNHTFMPGDGFAGVPGDADLLGPDAHSCGLPQNALSCRSRSVKAWAVSAADCSNLSDISRQP